CQQAARLVGGVALWAKVAGATTFVAIAAGLAALAWAAFGRGDGEEIAAVAPGAGSGSSVRNSVPADDQVTCPPIGNTAGIGGGVGLGWLAPGVACWTDRSDESEYRVEGSIIYWACDETGYAGRSENIPSPSRYPRTPRNFVCLIPLTRDLLKSTSRSRSRQFLQIRGALSWITPPVEMTHVRSSLTNRPSSVHTRT